MRKLAFVTDTAVTLTKEYMDHPDIYQIPLNVVVNGETFEDKTQFKDNMWITHLQNDDDLSTSLPSLERAVAILEEVKAEGYETVFLCTISSNISGTFNLFRLAIDTVGMENAYLLDTQNVMGAIGYLSEIIFEGARLDYSDEKIIKAIEAFNKRTILYALPRTLYNLTKSGRISKAVAKVATLLKINPILEWEAGHKSLELSGVTRSLKKALDKILKDLENTDLDKEKSRVYICTIDDLEIGNRFETMISKVFPKLKIIRDQIPGIIAVHGGLGCLVVQMIEPIELSR